MAARPDTDGSPGGAGSANRQPFVATPAGHALTPSEFLILLALAPDPAHGYRIMQIINDVFRAEMPIGAGTLYRSLQRLSAGMMIVELDDAGSGEEDARRRSYALTPRGSDVARMELRRIEGLARLARAQLGGR